MLLKVTLSVSNWHAYFFLLRLLLATNMTLLLSSENIYHLNLDDIEGGGRLVNKLVRLDRLPKTNPLEGLELLRSAWQDHDVAMMFAGRYKCWCKFLFVLQLILGWVFIVYRSPFVSLCHKKLVHSPLFFFFFF